jgi:hypothetical protein
LDAPVEHRDCVCGFGFGVGNELLVVWHSGAVSGAFVEEDSTDARVEAVEPAAAAAAAAAE